MTVMMDTSVYSSPNRADMDNHHTMRVSHDEDRSDPKDLCSLVVVDLDFHRTHLVCRLSTVNSR